jgi:hypothetical protein
VREVEVVSPYGSAGKDFCEKMPGPFGWVFFAEEGRLAFESEIVSSQAE